MHWSWLDPRRADWDTAIYSLKYVLTNPGKLQRLGAGRRDGAEFLLVCIAAAVMSTAFAIALGVDGVLEYGMLLLQTVVLGVAGSTIGMAAVLSCAIPRLLEAHPHVNRRAVTRQQCVDVHVRALWVCIVFGVLPGYLTLPLSMSDAWAGALAGNLAWCVCLTTYWSSIWTQLQSMPGAARAASLALYPVLLAAALALLCTLPGWNIPRHIAQWYFSNA